MLWLKEYLDRLGYADRPDYEFIRGLLRGMLEASGEPADLPYDWERADRICT